MRLLSVLKRFGFDPDCRACLARHKDNRIDFAALLASGTFDEYQRWQFLPKFHNYDFVVSFIGERPRTATFWGVYRVNGVRRVPFRRLPRRVLWDSVWHKGQPHYYYDLEPVRGYKRLEDGNFVIEWSSERSWVQRLRDYEVLEWPPLGDVRPRRGGAAGKGKRRSDNPPQSRFIDASALEGLRTEVRTITTKRSRWLRNLVLDAADGKCEVCGTDFSDLLDGLGIRVLQVHHRKQISALKMPRLTKVGDLAVVCANCHLLLHLNPSRAMKVETLRRKLFGA